MKVVMSSDEFGTEEFQCNDLKEANKVFERLRSSCAQQKEKDGIERTLTIIVREEKI